jgi:hypothetical protein
MLRLVDMSGDLKLRTGDLGPHVTYSILQEVGVKETHPSMACLYLTKSEQEVHACGTCPGPILNHSTTTTTNNNNNHDNKCFLLLLFQSMHLFKLLGHPPQRANLVSIHIYINT